MVANRDLMQITPIKAVSRVRIPLHREVFLCRVARSHSAKEWFILCADRGAPEPGQPGGDDGPAGGMKGSF